MPLSTKKATAQTVASNNIILYVIFRFHERMLICRFHELSHTYATILLANSIDVVAVATRLGHSDASTTLKVYAHALRRRDEDAARAAQGLLDRAADDLVDDETEK